MTGLVDTSVVLAHILEGDIAIHHAFRMPRTVCSELLAIEARRVIQRHRLTGALDDEGLAVAVERLESLCECLEVWRLSDSIKQRAAGPFPTVIGTLDALHLATGLEAARLEGDGRVTVFSFDRQLNLAARALGLAAPLDTTPA